MSLVTQLIKKYKVIAEEEDQPQEDDAYLSPTGSLGSKTSLGNLPDVKCDDKKLKNIADEINKVGIYATDDSFTDSKDRHCDVCNKKNPRKMVTYPSKKGETYWDGMGNPKLMGSDCLRKLKALLKKNVKKVAWPDY